MRRAKGPLTPDDLKAIEDFKRFLKGEMVGEEYIKYTKDMYCHCKECIRCGCGMWEEHHGVQGLRQPQTQEVCREESGEDTQ